MPNVEITIGAGRTPEQIRHLVHEVHTAVLRTVDTRPEHVRVIVREVPRAHWATGDVTLAERDAGAAGAGTSGDDLEVVPGDQEEQS